MAGRSRRKKANLNVTVASEVCIKKKSERLQLADVLCCVCKSVLVEPVSLPCDHRFCRSCWLATDALRCPLCRKRVGSWLRESARRNHLVDEKLWHDIRDQFSTEIAKKLNDIDIDLPEEPTSRQLSAPGEIRAEYEAELERLKAERLLLEQKHSQDTAVLIRKLQEEEDDAHKLYLEKLKRDEELAQQLQDDEKRNVKLVGKVNCTAWNANKSRGKIATIDRYLVKKAIKKEKHNEKMLATGNKSKSPITMSDKKDCSWVPPNYGNFLDDNQLNKSTVKMWEPPIDSTGINAQKEFSFGGPKVMRTKGAKKQLCPDPPLAKFVQSVPVSLPYSGPINKSVSMLVDQSRRDTSTSSDSVDSMRQELCYFKPIQSTTSTSRLDLKELIRVPAMRGSGSGEPVAPPSRPPDYIYGLHLLRGQHAFYNTPSAFVCLIKTKDGDSTKCDTSELKTNTKTAYKSPNMDTPTKHIYSFRRKPAIKQNLSKSNKLKKMRRTRSTSNLPIMIKEMASGKQTPKKKTTPQQKRKSKSESKLPQQNFKISPFKCNKLETNNVKLVTKNLSSPLEKCAAVISSKNKIVREINCKEYGLESNNNLTTKANPVMESLRIESALFAYKDVDKAEQERKDLELALRVEAEWNGGYALRRAPVKRRAPASLHPLMLARNKKIKV